MSEIAPSIRRAVADDAAVLAELVNYAGEGLPLYLWSGLAQSGEDPWDVGRRRQAAKTASDEIWVVDEGEGAIAGLTGYSIAAEPTPADAETPPLFRPLLELENLALSSWYVNVLAAQPAHRGRGLGRALLAKAEQVAREAGLDRMSIIVADRNDGAWRLYARNGYVETARRAIVKNGWSCASDNWVLLLKNLSV